VGRPPAAAPLQAQVIASTESLVEYETRRVLLQLTDTGPGPVRIDSIRTRWPEFIHAEGVTHFGSGPRWPLTLQPGEARLVAYDVRLRGKVTPGKQTLAFDVPAAWTAEGQAVSANVIATTEIAVAVLGESELLKLLTLPSLLFVPGFLILVVLGFFWQLEPLARARPQWSLPNKPGQPEFWVFSVTISIGVWALALLLWKRNVLERYNASDVARIWVISLLAGVVAFGVIVGVYQVFLHRARSPLKVLRALVEHEQPLAVRKVKFRVGSEEGTAFLIEDRGSTAQTVLLAPPIRLRWDPRTSPHDRRALERALAPRDVRAKDVAELLDRAKREKRVELFWRQTPLLTWPTHIQKKDVSEWRAGRDLLLQVEPAEEAG